jgi:cellulose synthase/poly-beta-1,6-N-acetylglucosamine synthase-like glycosyltransferase
VNAEFVFWLSAGWVAYTYAVYPVILFLLASLTQSVRDIAFVLRRQNRRGAARQEFVPRISLLVAAYNEASVIEEKLKNTAALDYPREQFELLLGLDASEDATPDIASGFAHPSFRVIRFPERRGKLAVINDLAERATGEILVFSDANTLLDSAFLRQIARHFAAPEVGAVCGEMRLTDASGNVEMEGIYWRYEVALKFLENRLNCVLGANGGAYAVRRSLYRPMVGWIVEDFQLPMEIRFEGHRVVYDPEALATEEAAPSLAAEYRRKVRIAAGNFQTLLRNPRFLNPFKGLVALAFFSHKVVRWLAPMFLLAALIANSFLFSRPFYAATFAAQILFYAAAGVGYVQQRGHKRPGLFSAVFYFVTLNVALMHGMLRYVTGRQHALWTATPRSGAVAPQAHSEESPASKECENSSPILRP